MKLAEEMRTVLGQRERPPRVIPSDAAAEEAAVAQLYGERTGTVNAAPTTPPLAPGASEPER